MDTTKIGNAVVRIHGTPDQERLKKATEKFMKQVMKSDSTKEVRK